MIAGIATTAIASQILILTFYHNEVHFGCSSGNVVFTGCCESPRNIFCNFSSGSSSLTICCDDLIDVHLPQLVTHAIKCYKGPGGRRAISDLGCSRMPMAEISPSAKM